VFKVDPLNTNYLQSSYFSGRQTGGLSVCIYRHHFQQTGLQKKRELSQTGAEFGLIFSSNESVPAHRKKGFYTSRLPKNEEIGGISVFNGLESFQKF
jgi:hypothetical protein